MSQLPDPLIDATTATGTVVFRDKKEIDSQIRETEAQSRHARDMERYTLLPLVTLLFGYAFGKHLGKSAE